ncbi:sec14l1 [Symbiodinium natans]|uniref:Sec14l1 protein n=1 Tax=Symbiodinium natans TaxID=878477 RepID=A0A812HMG0_9DINO|nr:sec14l1 [Symbiodinium natans]
MMTVASAAEAERMFRDMLEWRHDFDVEGKVHSWRREMERHRTRRARLCKRFAIEEQICNDKYGIPVRLLRLGVADSAGMIREFGQEAVLVDSLSKLEWTHEQIRNAMFRCRKLFRGQIQILDVGDYGDVPNWTGRMWNNLRLGPDIYKVFDGNYPETVRKVFIIRTSSLVHHGYTLVQRLLPQRTKRKLKLFGPKAAEWVHELRAELPEKQELPEFLRCDSEQAFRAATPRGGVVPEGIAGSDQGRFEDDEDAEDGPEVVARTTSQELAKQQARVSDAVLRFLLAVVFALAAAVLGGQLAKDGIA